MNIAIAQSLPERLNGVPFGLPERRNGVPSGLAIAGSLATAVPISRLLPNVGGMIRLIAVGVIDMVVSRTCVRYHATRNDGRRSRLERAQGTPLRGSPGAPPK